MHSERPLFLFSSHLCQLFCSLQLEMISNNRIVIKIIDEKFCVFDFIFLRTKSVEFETGAGHEYRTYIYETYFTLGQ